MSIKYSIIIPHFNRPDLIMNGINSFKELKNKEIIIIDAGSEKDNIQKLKQNLEQFAYEHNINLFLSDKKLYLPMARNKGLKIAKGKWIYFIDDDDDVRPKFIKFLNKGKLKDKYDFYRFPNIEKKNGKFYKIITKVVPWNYKYSPQVSTYLFNKSFLNNNNIFFNEKIKYAEDWFFCMEIMEHKNINSKYVHIFSFNYNIITNQNSIMRTKKINPLNNLMTIDEILNTNYKNKKSFALEVLINDYYSIYRNNLYTNKTESLTIYKNYIKKIQPSFKSWLQMNPAFKYLYLVYLLKKNNKKL